ncbi:MAG: ZIP family metal transporter [Halobacteriales archaeon]
MAGETETVGGMDVPRWLGALVPIILLAALVGALLLTSPFAGVQSGEPLPDVAVSHTTLPDDETIVLHVTNAGAEPVTIQQVLVDEAYWSFSVKGTDGRTLAPAESARIVVPYHWTPGWDLGVGIVLDNGATFHHTIVAPKPAPGLTADLLWTLAWIGLLVGTVPIALGMLWFPFMQTMSTRLLHATLAFAAGVLGFLAFDAGFEAFEVAHTIPGSLEGNLLVVLGIVGAALLVQAVSARKGESPLALAYMVALGIGLHNLAEGLAIGSAFALGRASLGAFLVIGFMVHNVTEGPAVVAPVADGKRPSLWHFGALGAIAGFPVIAGGWIGSAAFSPTLGAFFLALGVGAILQVDWEIASMIRDRGRLGTASNILAALVGFALMYATDLLVTL